MESRTLLGTLVLVGLLLAPTAASHEEPPADEAVPLKYYLNAESENLTLSTLAPSAANATTWSTQLDPYGWYGDEKVEIDLIVPGGRFLVNESQGVEGAITGSYECDADLWSFCGGVDIQVLLVEGERQVVLLDRYLSTSERTLSFAGDFPGHGRDETPHTHGNGTSADRGLFTDDFVFRIVLTAADDFISEWSLGSPTYTVNLEIDGVSFAHVWALAPAPLPPVAPGNRTAGSPAPGNTSAPSDGGNNTTAGNASASPQGGQAASEESYSLDGDALPTVPGLGSLGFLAAVAAAGFAFTRRVRGAD